MVDAVPSQQQAGQLKFTSRFTERDAFHRVQTKDLQDRHEEATLSRSLTLRATGQEVQQANLLANANEPEIHRFSSEAEVSTLWKQKCFYNAAAILANI